MFSPAQAQTAHVLHILAEMVKSQGINSAHEQPPNIKAYFIKMQ